MKYHTTLAAAAMILIAGCGKEEVSTPEAEPAPAPQPVAVAAEPVKHPLPGDPEAGKAVYVRICSACHQADGKGNPLMGSPNLTDDTWLHGGRREDIVRALNEGIVSQMPAHGKTLAPEQIHLVALYVYSRSHGADGLAE